MEKWNEDSAISHFKGLAQENPNLCVVAHDRILAINGVSGAAVDMVARLKDPDLGYIYITALHYGVDEAVAHDLSTLQL